MDIEDKDLIDAYLSEYAKNFKVASGLESTPPLGGYYPSPLAPQVPAQDHKDIANIIAGIKKVPAIASEVVNVARPLFFPTSTQEAKQSLETVKGVGGFGLNLAKGMLIDPPLGMIHHAGRLGDAIGDWNTKEMGSEAKALAGDTFWTGLNATGGLGSGAVKVFGEAIPGVAGKTIANAAKGYIEAGKTVESAVNAIKSSPLRAFARVLTNAKETATAANAPAGANLLGKAKVVAQNLKTTAGNALVGAAHNAPILWSSMVDPATDMGDEYFNAVKDMQHRFPALNSEQKLQLHNGVAAAPVPAPATTDVSAYKTPDVSRLGLLGAGAGAAALGLGGYGLYRYFNPPKKKTAAVPPALPLTETIPAMAKNVASKFIPGIAIATGGNLLDHATHDADWIGKKMNWSPSKFSNETFGGGLFNAVKTPLTFGAVGALGKGSAGFATGATLGSVKNLANIATSGWDYAQDAMKLNEATQQRKEMTDNLYNLKWLHPEYSKHDRMEALGNRANLAPVAPAPAPTPPPVVAPKIPEADSKIPKVDPNDSNLVAGGLASLAGGATGLAALGLGGYGLYRYFNPPKKKENQ